MQPRAWHRRLQPHALEAATLRLRAATSRPGGCDLTPQVSEADVRALRARLRAKLKQVTCVSGMHTRCTHHAHTTHTSCTHTHTPCTPHAHLAQHWMRVIDLLRGWDKDGDGIVSKPEFVKALKTLGFKFELETAAQLFAEFDADGSGEIDLKELKRKILEADKVVEPRRDVDGPEEAAAAAAAAAPTLTSLDLADNQLGGGALGPLLRGLRAGACALRALDLSRNRLPARAYTCTWTWTWTCIMRHAPCALPTYILPTPCRHPADTVPTYILPTSCRRAHVHAHT